MVGNDLLIARTHTRCPELWSSLLPKPLKKNQTEMSKMHGKARVGRFSTRIELTGEMNPALLDSSSCAPEEESQPVGDCRSEAEEWWKGRLD